MSLNVLALAAGLLLGQTETATDTPPFTEAQLDYLEKLRDQIREETAGSGGASSAAPAAQETGPSRLELKAEVYMKWLYRNDATQGCVSYGNPHPSGDNYSGNNGACPEFALTLIGRPMAKIEGGFRLQSRYGMDFADWFENGDKKAQVDASGESLGQNHSAPIQLRGIYVRIAEPLPFIDWFLAGSSDLSYWDAFTVGKVRFIDRFNAKGLFLKSHIPGALDVLIARIALPKLFGSANYGSLEEPLVTNPFWARDAVYALQLATPRGLIDGVSITANGDVILDEEADAADPDAPGSTNAIDKPDAVVSTAGRFVGVNASLGLNLTRWDALRINGTLAFSYNSPNSKYVTNLARGGLGFTNIVNDTVTDVAGVVRIELPELLGEGRSLKAEYFNIGADFNSVMGARREDDVLLTDGFLDGGELPTLNLANELIDFNDAFYESIIGWHGGTVVLAQQGDLLDASADHGDDLQHQRPRPGHGHLPGLRRVHRLPRYAALLLRQHQRSRRRSAGGVSQGSRSLLDDLRALGDREAELVDRRQDRRHRQADPRQRRAQRSDHGGRLQRQDLRGAGGHQRAALRATDRDLGSQLRPMVRGRSERDLRRREPSLLWVPDAARTPLCVVSVLARAAHRALPLRGRAQGRHGLRSHAELSGRLGVSVRRLARRAVLSLPVQVLPAPGDQRAGVVVGGVKARAKIGQIGRDQAAHHPPPAPHMIEGLQHFPPGERTIDRL
jgi:hypothetical protein